MSENTAATRDPRDIVTPDAFMVAPQLMGRALATPMRRAGAMLIDLLVIGLLSQSGSIGLAFAIALLSYELVRGRRSISAVSGRRLPAMLAAALVAAVILLLGNLDTIDVQLDDAEPETVIAGESVPEVAEQIALAALSTRVEQLEEENQRLRGEFSPSVLAERLFDDAGFGFGWAAVYFSLLTAWWQGQTLGKRLLRMRLVRLNGEQLTVWNAFDRYGGYAAGFATGLLGFAQVFWDPNRQAIHDKICATVVVDERHLRRDPDFAMS